MNRLSKTCLFLAHLGLLTSLTLSACGPQVTPTPTLDPAAVFTQAAGTIVAEITETAAAQPTATPEPPSATPEPSPTPEPSATPGVAVTPTSPPAPAGAATSTPVPADPATAFGCYNASFVAHVTQPYAPAFNPGDKFVKTWRVKNTGTCDWPRGFKLVFVSGDRFGADTIGLSQKVLAGATTEITLNMTAPYLTGVVSSNWQLTTDIGKPFGQLLSTSITLPGLPAGSGSADGCLNSVLVAELSVPSGTKLSPSETFTKTWQIKNTGSCTWNRSYQFTFIGGELFGADTRKIRAEVGPGGTIDLSLDMTAPGSAGTYNSSWQMASDTGVMFGQVFNFNIVVK